MKNIITLTATLLGVASLHAATQKPNVILVLADDLGYGDISGLNPNSKIPTPNIDRMCNHGLVFTNAHSASALSTPSRYAIMTGRYPWRTSMKKGVLKGYSEAMIPSDRKTIADMFRSSGYQTACIGKWHLGWDWTKKGEEVDFSAPITNSPVDRGFDYFFGIPASLDMAPYLFVENNKATALPTATIEPDRGINLIHGGAAAPDFKPEECLPTLAERTLDYIGRQKGSDRPFFLYFPLSAPHTPVLPTKEYQGLTIIGPYGDFVVMIDDIMGKIFDQLKRTGQDKNTIVIFSADNGCAPYIGVKEMERQGHFPSYIYRGYKSNIFEGGHHIPLIISRGDHYASPREVSSLVSLTDFYATFAQMLDYDIKANEAEDSFSMLPLLTGKGKPTRKDLIAVSGMGMFSLISPELKLIFGEGPDWNFKANAKLGNRPPMQLYDLSEDPGEKNNLIGNPRYAGQVAKMTSRIRKYVAEGRSTPGPAAKNDSDNDWPQIGPFIQ